MTPRATYRLQFHKGFTFADGAGLAPYLAALGVSHLYSSPILAARAGSRHGYDVIDHSRINPELGGEAAFRAMAAAFRAQGLGIILDIVPNHMAVGGADNRWWLDLLEHGPASAYAEFFDVEWQAPGLEGKLLAPFLDGALEAVIARGHLRLIRDEAIGKLAFAYFTHRFPLRPGEEEALGGRKLDALTPSELRAIHERQNFVLADWRLADRRINWRRFFDITDLAALRAERDEVFEATHGTILALHAEGLMDGVRVDHIDGLADSRAYCRKLRERLGPAAYIVVEKILAAEEALPADWPIDGTTGYDFMNEVSALQHAPDEDGILALLWQRYGARARDFEAEERSARREIVTSKFAAQTEPAARAFGREVTAEALEAVVTEMRCYRSYATGRADSPEPGPYFAAAAARAGAASATIARVMAERSGRAETVEAVRRFNQLSAPVAAKAVEDTAFYRYGRLISRNDVGFDPRQETLPLAAFHRRMAERAKRFPRSMLATATHDHKRGEDARARLAVLSELPALWRETVESWFALNSTLRAVGLAAGDEYQLYQSLVGLWPIPGTGDADFASLPERIEGWCRKFLREGKLRSSWQAPDEEYERRFCRFAETLLAAKEGQPFRASLDRLVARLAPAACLNSLVQCALRCTLPGVPDLFQGRELWDFSLVDPDNRRPVDYAALAGALGAPLSLVGWQDGRVKQALIAALLAHRRAHPALFLEGDYRPLAVDGPRADHVIAFERVHEGARLTLLALRHAATAPCPSGSILPTAAWWGDTRAGGVPVADYLGDFPVHVMIAPG